MKGKSEPVGNIIKGKSEELGNVEEKKIQEEDSLIAEEEIFSESEEHKSFDLPIKN